MACCNVHPLKVKTAGVPTAKLMSLFGVELDDILKSRPDRGINFRDNDLFLDATTHDAGPADERPPHEIVGARRSSRADVWRRIRSVDRAVTGNYIWFRGAAIRFGRLTMTDADLKLIDMDPQGSVRFLLGPVQRATRRRVSKNTPDHALRTYMPDFSDIPRNRR